MMEFGEKLKRAREAKGFTQQTVADNLYVTRQAVSRWECGARYPDLLTAKKLSELLEASLDDLLSGEEMRTCVEKNSVIEDAAYGILQSTLFTFSSLAYILLCVFSIRLFISAIQEINMQSVRYSIGFICEYAICAVMLFIGLLFSIKRNLTPQKTGVIMAAYFGMSALTKILSCAQAPSIGVILFEIIAHLICATIILYFFLSEKRITPVPIYCISFFYLIRALIMYFQMMPYSAVSAFMIRTVWLAAVAGLTVLLSYQASILEKKWHYAMK